MADEFDEIDQQEDPQDPFKKYGGKQIEDPFKKYGGKSIDVKKKDGTAASSPSLSGGLLPIGSGSAKDFIPEVSKKSDSLSPEQVQEWRGILKDKEAEQRKSVGTTRSDYSRGRTKKFLQEDLLQKDIEPGVMTTGFKTTDPTVRSAGDKEFSKETIGASAKKLGKAAAIGLSDVVSKTLKSVGVARKKLNLIDEYKDVKEEEMNEYKAGQWVENTTKDLVGELTPEEQKEFAVKLAGAGGQALGFLAGGAAGRLFKVSPAFTTGGLGAAVNSASEYENALAAGATPEEASKVYWTSALWGTTDAWPFVGAFRKLDKYTGGLATGALARKLASSAGGRLTNDIAQGIFKEAAQEAGQQVLTNATAQNTYDETRKLFDGVVESAAIGGIIGGTMTGALSAIRERRMATNITPQEDAELAKAEEFAQEKVNEAIKNEHQEKVKIHHETRVKDNLKEKGLSEESQEHFIDQSLREKEATEKAEASADPTLQKQQKEIAKEAGEIKEQLLKGVKPEDVVTEKQQKAIEEKENAEREISRLEESRKLDNKQFAEQRKELDGRIPEDRIKIEKLEKKKAEKNEDYDLKIEKIKKDIPKDDLQIASEAALKDINIPEVAKLFAANPEQGLKEAAEQLNASKGEAETARKFYGDTISNIALKLYPKEKVAPQDVSGKSGEEVGLGNVLNKAMGNKGLEIMDADIRINGKSVVNNIDKATPKQVEKIKNDFEELKKLHPDKNLQLLEENNSIIIEPQQAPKEQLPSQQDLSIEEARPIIEENKRLWGERNKRVDEVSKRFQAGELNNKEYIAEINKVDEQFAKENPDYYKFEDGNIGNSDKVNNAVKNLYEKGSKKLISDLTEGLEKHFGTKIPTKEQLPAEEEVRAEEPISENIPPAAEPPKSEPPSPPGEEVAPEEKGNKALAVRLVNAENVTEASKEGIRREGLQYEPQSQAEAEIIAKEVIDAEGIDQAVLRARAQEFGGDVNTLIQTEALNRLKESEDNAKTPEEKLEYAKRFAEVAINLDKWARDKAGRGISALAFFYKKSPLGIQMMENAKRKQDFEQWAKQKDKSWKEFFDEMMKDPEFEKEVTTRVKEELKKERATTRKERIRKVDEWFDQAKKDIEGKGGATYVTIIPPKVMSAALEGMRKAYHAGEKVAELIQTAIDEISAAIGNAPWDKEKFRREWEDKLKEKAPKEKISDEELKAKVLDKFRKKLKGLTDKQKDDVIRRAHRQLIENGALEFEDFKEIIAKVVGKGELTIEEANKMKELVKQANELEDYAKKARESRTPEAFNQYREAQVRTARASRELNDMFYNKPDIIKRLTGLMQLNTLGIVSLINNPIYNIVNQLGVRFPVGALNDVADRIISGVIKNYEREYNTFETQKDFWNMVGVGGKEATQQMLTGLNRSDYTQKELYSEQIRPFKAIRDLNEWRKGNKQLSKRQVIDKMLQGTAGIPAEVVARMLNIGDKPQRFAAGGAQSAAFAKALGLKDIDKKLFMEFPREEAYRAYKAQGLDDAKAGEKADYVRDVIGKEAERSTFQQDNLLNDLITAAAGKLFGGKDTGAAALAKTLVISPYIKIPTNAFWSMYNLLNPEIALLQATVHGARSGVASKRGETNRSKLQLREARYWLAHAIVGMATRAAILALVERGAFVPPSDEDDPKKEREGVNQFSKAGTIKIGNMTISNRWFGQWGMLANQISKKYQDMTPEQRENADEFMNIVIGGMEKEGVQELENGVFSNSASIIESVFGRGGNVADRYMMNTLNLMTNIVQPATLAQHSRASLNEVPTIKGDTFLEKVNQNFAQRSSLYRNLFDVNIKYKRNMWGETIPKGGNILSRQFGISKENPQQFARPLYDDYLRTNDTGFFPSFPSDRLNGQKLNTAQYEKLSEHIGQERKRLIEPYINNMALIDGFGQRYSELDDETKKRVLDYLYDYGRLVGLQKFYREFPEFKKRERTETEAELNELHKGFQQSVKDLNPIEDQ